MKNRNRSKAAARILALVLVVAMLLAGIVYLFASLGIFF